MYPPPTVYCVDTSAVLEWWERSYAPDVFPTFWTGIKELIDAGLLIAPDEVRAELVNPPALVGWLDANGSGAFRPLDAALQASVKHVVTEIRDRCRAIGIPLRPGDFKADPFVVALARIVPDCVVVTEERAHPNGRPKIPDICSWYGLECINSLELLRRLRWSF